MALEDISQYLRLDKFPHIWCPGCGNGIIMQSVLRGLDKLGLDQNKIAVISGIGCSSRAAGYLDFNTLHTTHGRALTFATGIKMAKPELTVIVLTGDGDCSAIGGNHLIHAARRNIDLNVVVFNNSIYGMTGGQFSPTTPLNDIAATAPFGNLDPPFDLCELTKAAGATYIARSTTYHATQISNFVIKAIQNKGFSFLDIITQCPVYYGRMNKIKDAVDMLKEQRDNARNIKQWSILSDEEKQGKFVIGELHNQPRPEYTESYQSLIERHIEKRQPSPKSEERETKSREE
ncbi:2-oxoacid:ferredoxin oxidoreductase subunit beta [Candidatus Falkowbacteria bacterium RIFCSPLOWO2_12_FULL_45_13]|uniref:2-oxoacid:ferredoxin oxidoreductase subunit beta n=1 Tax=Candidatus Falkowbacteria bacterium RIFCSPLOWO2_12_FULL_45_13 TaxID=1797991 RepID=A0A1F5SZC3_9BACT|nr:MAG: 2-oxoacid:ferredoxin oxidoreductase subunit beta [Candidatus Falkowbacteria bacterium RIFCSPLOWO2_12_FULL_45_13]